MTALKANIEELSLALEVSKKLCASYAEGARRSEALENTESTFLKRKNEELTAALKVIEAQAADLRTANIKLKTSVECATPTYAQFMEAMESFKAEQLMACISERVFIHVIAPRTILQLNNQSREYRATFPLDSEVKSFIKREIEPHFEMVFKTLDAGSGIAASSDSHARAVVEQRAPDGTSVKSYSERFNSTLANFIKKCVTES